MPRKEIDSSRHRSSVLWAGPVLPVLVFLLLYSWRPLKLGLYSDDWLILLHPSPGTWAAWSDLIGVYQNRPISAVMGWLVQLASGWSAASVQVVGLVMLAGAAASVGWFTAVLVARVSGQQSARLWGAGVATAAYLAFPWTLGFSWVTAALSAVPATVFFCIAAGLLALPGGEQLRRQIVACVLMAASFLTYEAFYGQFIIVIVLACSLGTLKAPSLLRPALLLLAVNIACFANNRLAAGNRKTFSTDWLQIFLYGYGHHLWPNLLRSFHEVAPVVAMSLLVALGSGIVLLAKTVGRLNAALAIAAIAAGILGAGMFYAIAGYGLITVGIFARVTVVMSLYGAVFMGLASAAAAARLVDQPRLARAHIAATVALVVAFAIASAYRLVDWVGSWQTQLAVLEQLPAEAKTLPAPDRGYLYVGPLGPADVPIAAAPWEVAGTIAFRVYQEDPALARQIMSAAWNGPGQRWMALPPHWALDFDGETIRGYVCGNPAPVVSLQAKELWTWTLGDSQLKMAAPGFRVPCESSDP
jgi:hypothetical protein